MITAQYLSSLTHSSDLGCVKLPSKKVRFSYMLQQPQGKYWAGRAPPPNNGNYQYGRR